MIQNGSWSAGFYVSGDPDQNRVFNSEGADHDIFLIDWNKRRQGMSGNGICGCLPVYE